MNPIQNHPNATTALVSSIGLGTIIVQIAQHFGVNLTTQDGIWIAGGLATIALFVGRHGLVGIKNVILHGTGNK